MQRRSQRSTQKAWISGWEILEWTAVLASIAMIVGAILAALLFWAMGRSQARTACYRTATSVEQCQQPTWLEKRLALAVQPPQAATTN